METYRTSLQNLLKQVIGTTDVSTTEYKQIGRETQKADLDFKKVVASIRLSDPEKVQLPRDTDPIVEGFIEMSIP